MRLLRREAVSEKAGLSRSAIYAGMAGGMFPKPVKIGEKAVAWSEAEIEHGLREACRRATRRRR